MAKADYCSRHDKDVCVANHYFEQQSSGVHPLCGVRLVKLLRPLSAGGGYLLRLQHRINIGRAKHKDHEIPCQSSRKLIRHAQNIADHSPNSGRRSSGRASLFSSTISPRLILDTNCRKRLLANLPSLSAASVAASARVCASASPLVSARPPARASAWTSPALL